MNAYRLTALLLTLLACALFAPLADAQDAPAAAADEQAVPIIALGTPFVDNVILQRDMPVPVWGEAVPGAQITVTFNSQTKTTIADGERQWRITLDPMPGDTLTSVNEAPQGRELRVDIQATLGNEEIASHVSISNVLIGEVWLCSGQSNMAGPLRMGPYPPGTIENANYPALRQWRDEQWIICTPQTAPVFSRVAFCFAREIQGELNVPIALMMAATGGSRIEQWMREVPEDLINDSFRRALDRPDFVTNYDRYVAPLAGFAMRGALWYQGEANASEGPEYFLKMQSLIAGWRDAWGQGDFPFYYVQIASIGESAADNPAMGDGRAQIRNAQLQALTLPNTGMAVTIDIGAVREHPINKYDVGLRLSRWALHNQYGYEELVPSGPIYLSHAVQGSTIRVRFDYADSGLILAQKDGYEPAVETPDADIPWLSIQDADGNWHWAQGRIDGNDLIVWNDAVQNPVHVRYAYTQYPTGSNLYNREGLPASPFSTSGY